MKTPVDTATRLVRELRSFVTSFESRTTVVDLSAFPVLLVPENPLRWSIRFAVPFEALGSVSITPFQARTDDTFNIVMELLGTTPFLYKDDPILCTAEWHGSNDFGIGNMVIFEQFLRN